MIVTELPRVTTDVLGRGAEHRTLDRDSPVRAVVVPWGEESFDRYAKQHDAALLLVDVPTRDAAIIGLLRQGADLEAHIGQLRPGTAKELHGGADGQIESIDSALQRWQRRAYDFAATQPPVPPVPSPATGSGRTAGGPAARHDESLCRAARHPRGDRVPPYAG